MGPPRAYPDPVCRPISSLHNSSIHHFLSPPFICPACPSLFPFLDPSSSIHSVHPFTLGTACIAPSSSVKSSTGSMLSFVCIDDPTWRPTVTFSTDHNYAM